MPVEIIEDEFGWSPYLSLDDANKLDTVRRALKAGDVNAAATWLGLQASTCRLGGGEIVAVGPPR